MDIFEVHRRIMDDYTSYIRSFVSISDNEMRRRADQHLNDGHLWTEPLLTFNPSFAKVGRIEQLVASGVLAALLGEAFRGYELFEHQLEAIHWAQPAIISLSQNRTRSTRKCPDPVWFSRRLSLSTPRTAWN